MKQSRLILIILIAALVASTACADTKIRTIDNCYSIAVGKDVSACGNVIMAHNEDDGGPCVVNHYKMPRKQFQPDEKITLLKGGQVDQVAETYAYIWSEIPNFLFSDSYINEFGVSIASDACPSREDRPDLTDGGISYYLRQIAVQRATSAKEAVRIAGQLVERYGYDGSGRTYVICDPNEAWLMAVVNGKHWVAQRVPDNEVAIIANTYTIRGIDLSDTDNFLGAEDIIAYAKSRGWYSPKTDGRFDFAKAYADSSAANHPTNIGRHWAGLRFLSEKEYAIDDRLPFSFVPKSKVDVSDIMAILRDHYEGTEHYEVSQDTNSHDRSYRPICRPDTRTSFVVRLRDNMPLDIGINYWVCLGSPCVSTYIPFYFGIDQFPKGYAGWDDPAEELYNARLEAPFKADPANAFWTYANLVSKTDGPLHHLIPAIHERSACAEKCAFEEQAQFEKSVLELYSEDREAAVKMLNEYSARIYEKAIKDLSEIVVVE